MGIEIAIQCMNEPTNEWTNERTNELTCNANDFVGTMNFNYYIKNTQITFSPAEK